MRKSASWVCVLSSRPLPLWITAFIRNLTERDPLTQYTVTVIITFLLRMIVFYNGNGVFADFVEALCARFSKQLVDDHADNPL